MRNDAKRQKLTLLLFPSVPPPLQSLQPLHLLHPLERVSHQETSPLATLPEHPFPPLVSHIRLFF